MFLFEEAMSNEDHQIDHGDQEWQTPETKLILKLFKTNMLYF